MRPLRVESVRVAFPALSLLTLAGCELSNPLGGALRTLAWHYFAAGVITGVLSMLVLVVLLGGRRDSDR